MLSIFSIITRRRFRNGMLTVLALFLGGSPVWAAGPPAPSSMSFPLVIALVLIMIVLLVAIALLANVLLGVARYQQEAERENKKSGAGATAAAIIALLLLSFPGMAQDAAEATAAVTQAPPNYGGLSATAFYFMTGVILVEVIVIITLLAQLKGIIARQRERQVAEAAVKGMALAPAKPKVSWWDRFNKFKPVEQEADLDLGHDYDGIRELDNRLPPWWLWGFYITIIFAVIYLWRYHVSHTAPLSAEEYAISVRNAEEKQKEYLKKAANLVDENSVKLLTESKDIAAGRSIFEQNCTPCHGKAGEGNTVGPNLTDNYWLHGGSINDVFRSIKYGWQDKGMRSWKDDFTPSQIAQIASFVKSLKGSNPANAKAPQGELYDDSAVPAPAADSSADSSAHTTAVSDK